MKILLTAFDPFGGEPVNPAQKAVEAVSDVVAGAEVVKCIVPTVFGKSIETVYEAMKKSYGYTLKGDCFVDGLEATQKVNFRALNVGRVENAASAKINEVLEELLAQLPEEEV